MEKIPTAEEIASVVGRALAEDLGSGDRSGEALALGAREGSGQLLAKARGRFFGRAPFEESFRQLDPRCRFSWSVDDGAPVACGQVLCRFTGTLRALLAAERTALNFAQRLSGVCTRAAAFAERVKGLPVILLDTRKTTPGLRALEKAAVAAGGMHNHRFGLFDRVLLKENHQAAAGSLARAVEQVRRCYGEGEPLIVEVRTLDELAEALRLQVGHILLDNMDLAALRRAVETTAGRAKLEASGNVTLDNVRAVAECGVDFISVGAVTHSAPVLDLSILLDGQR